MSEDFRILAKRRLAEAKVLLAADEWSGAYYLAGYATECALKACVLRGVKRFHMPDKKQIADTHTHDLATLLDIAGLKGLHSARANVDKLFASNWAVVKDWNEASRYSTWSETAARDLLVATTQRGSGVFQWIKAQW